MILSRYCLKQHPTLVDWIEQQARLQPESPALCFIEPNNSEQQLTFADVSRRVRALAATLQDSFAPGSRALILFPPGVDYVIALLACLYANLTAVPVSLSGVSRVKRVLARLDHIAASCHPALILTGTEIAQQSEEALTAFARAHKAAVELTDTIPMDDSQARRWQRPDIDAQSMAFLQYTSGSTGQPKGVINRHANLIANLEFLSCLTLPGPDARVLSWLPLYHDLGLIMGILAPLVYGNQAFYFAPAGFSADPLRWLELASQKKATVLPCPSFSLALCLEAVCSQPQRLSGIDLSSVVSLVPCAEPVHAQQLDDFYRCFSACGLQRRAIKPSYGLAEATLIAAGNTAENTPVYLHLDKVALKENEIRVLPESCPESRCYVGCGNEFGGQTLHIVDPHSRQVLSPGQPGEIWLSGPSVADGYWQLEDITEQNFRAHSADSEDRNQYLRTGDLGFIYQGQLYITGRLKDVLIHRGQCHWPSDIEATASTAHPDAITNAAAAFAIEVEGKEALVLVMEMRRHQENNIEELVNAVRMAIASEHQLAVWRVVLIRKGTLPRTSSGKVRRKQTRTAWQQGRLHVLWDEEPQLLPVPVHETLNTGLPDAHQRYRHNADTAAVTEAQLIHWINNTVADLMGTIAARAIDPEQSLFACGLDSIGGTTLVNRIDSHWGIRLAAHSLFDNASPRALARLLLQERNRQGVTDTVDETKREPQSVAVPASRLHEPEPVAIIGMAFRLPGAAGGEIALDDSFWQLLASADSAVRPMPTERFLTQQNIPGFGAYLNNPADFDADFFGMSAREAMNTDPQQRLLLEVTWHALEDAGLRPSCLRGRDIGVFTGLGTGDYAHLPFMSGCPDHLDAYYGTGNAFAAACGRLSWFFGWEGPSVAVDTACSSSHSALHMACQALRLGECELAVAAGVKLQLLPQIDEVLHRAGMLAADGRCKTFDAAADGYVRGEGCVVFLLKPLTKALADGDNIRALIRASLVRQDGASSSLSAPNGDAQQRLLERTLQQAGLSAGDIDYIELHGTGTRLGDPIEWQSIAAVFAGQERQHPLWLGSVKTNIGHLEAAAGAAGLVKTVLALERGAIPPHAGLTTINPLINLSQIPAQLPQQTVPWPLHTRPRRAGITACGFTGTIAHIIVEQAPQAISSPPCVIQEQGAGLFVLSARSLWSLNALRKSWLAFMNTEISLPALAGAMARHREHLPLRMAVVADNLPELQQALTAAVASEGIIEAPRVGFMFTGQGAQYAGMGRQLYQTETAFRSALDAADVALESVCGESIRALIFSDSPAENERLNQTMLAQPALFAIGYSLARLWQSYGVEPCVLLGHSIGEFAALVIAGALELADAARLICHRGTLMQQLPPGGGMLAVRMTASEALTLLQTLPADDASRVALAAINGPKDIVLSGADSVLEDLYQRVTRDGISARALKVSHAFHSPLLDSMLDAWQARCAECNSKAPQISLISTLNAELMEIAPDAGYWRDHARQTVRFSDALRLAAEHCDLLLEIGPHAILSAQAQRNQSEENWPQALLCVASMRRGSDEVRTLRDSMCALYLQGQNFDWDSPVNAAFSVLAATRQELPRYPFERQTYWLDYDEDAPRAQIVLPPRPQPASACPVPLYRQQWETLDTIPEPVPADGRWWLLSLQDNDTNTLITALHRQGVEPVAVTWEERTQIIAECRSDDVLIWLTPAERVTENAINDPALGVWPLVSWVRSLQQHNLGLRILLVTVQAQATEEGECCHPDAAALWGAARALAIEYPNCQWLMLDTTEEMNADSLATTLLRAARCFNSEDALAVRGERWLHPRLVPVTQEKPDNNPSLTLCPTGTYLIAGAFGALGRYLSEWLIGRGARHLLLIGRQLPRAGVCSLLDNWRSQGVRIDCLQSDIADEDQAYRLFSHVEQLCVQGYPLKGVFHCAGIGRFNALDAITEDDYHAVTRAKIKGTQLLHYHTLPYQPDWFVCFTSISGVWGSRLQIHYGAANAWQDALMQKRRSQGLPGMAIAWGPWSGGAGMSEVDDSLLNYLRMAGIRRQPPLRYLATLERLMSASQQNTGGVSARWLAADIDWKKFVPLFALYCHTSTFSPCLQAQTQADPAAQLPVADDSLLLADMPAEQRQQHIDAFVYATLARTLRAAPDRILPDVELLALGMDSILLMDFARLCETRIGIHCPLKDLFEQRTPARLSAWLCQQADSIIASVDVAVRDLPAMVIMPDPSNRFQPFPLTELQYAYWVGRQEHYALGGIACHAYLEADAAQGIDHALLEHCWNELIARHDALRLVIDENGRQRVLENPGHWSIELQDLSDASPHDIAQHCDSLREALSHQVLDPACWPLFDLRLCHFPDGSSRLYISIDMLINDATSSQLLWDELVALYRAGGDSAAAGLIPFTISFRDYVQARAQDIAHQAARAAARDYWLERLRELPPPPQLPLCSQALNQRHPHFTRLQRQLNASDWQRLRQRATEQGVTPASLLVAAFAEVLAAWSEQARFCLNLTFFDRLPWHEDVPRLVGDFTAVTLLPLDYTEIQSFARRVLNVNRQVLESLEHRAFSAVDVLREWNRGTEDNISMPVIFTSQLGVSDPTKGVSKDSPLGRIVYGISQTPQVWLDHQACELDGALVYNWDLVADLFPAGVPEAMFTAYGDLLESLARDDACWQQPLISLIPQQQQQVRRAVNDTVLPLPDCCLDELFFNTAARTPTALALKTQEQHWCYASLADWSRKLAWQLIENEVQPGERVAILMPKCAEQVVACLAIAAVGAVWVPLDVSMPALRLHSIISGSHIRVILTEATGVTTLPLSPDDSNLCIVTVCAHQASEVVPPLPHRVRDPSSPAYVIYTSGSTGIPKGVLIDNRGAVNTVLDINRRFHIDDSTCLAGVSSLSFDLSVYDIFGTFAAGGCLVLPDAHALRDPSHWLRLVQQQGVTLWNSVPALLELLLDAAVHENKYLTGLRAVLLSGDWIPLTLPSRLRQLAPDARLIALGGATEASIWSNWYEVTETPAHWRSIPYGYPLSNQYYRVLDNGLRDRPDWVAGSLYIGGRGVALGYENDADRTAASFIQHPRDKERLYCTGDRARYWPDGTLEFLGRSDSQLKIAGNRIEAGEVEAALLRNPAVREAVVDAIESAGAGKQLAAWLTLQENTTLSVVETALPACRDNHAVFSAAQRCFADALPVITETKVASFRTLIDALGQRLIADVLETAGVSADVDNDIAQAVQKLAPAADYVNLAHTWCQSALTLPAPRWSQLYEMAMDSGLPRAGLLRLQHGAAERLGVLRGTQDALELFYGSDTTLAPEQLTQANPLTGVSMLSLTKALRIIAVQLGRVPRVLEIGARSGVATQELLQALSDCPLDYTLSDASALLIEQAASQLSSLPAAHGHTLHYRVCDMETDIPVTLARDIDVVIAVNSLHRSRRIDRLLRDIAAMLNPAGWLLAVEMTHNSVFQLATVALLEKGYTALADCRRETALPLLSARQWQEELSTAGFCVTQTYAPRMDTDGGVHLLLAQNAHHVSRFMPQSLLTHLATLLPDYMVPKKLIPVDRMPLSPTGKIARSLLPRPQSVTLLRQTGGEQKNQYSGPGATLADLWAQFLKTECPRPQDHFFAAGGDSLIAVRLIEKIRHVLRRQISLRDLFAAPQFADFAARVEQAEPWHDSLPSLSADITNRHQPFPLTDVQQAYWIGRQDGLELGGVSTHLYVEMEVHDIDFSRLEDAWQQLILRHDMLRAVIDESGWQRILPEVSPYTIPFCCLCESTPEERQQWQHDTRALLSHQVFDCALWPLFDMRAARIDKRTLKLCISLDNLICDGRSMLLLLDEWSRLSHAPHNALPALTISFRDYVLAIEQQATRASYQHSLQYWLERLDSLPEGPALPRADDYLPVNAPVFRRRESRLSRTDWQQLRARATAAGITPNALLLTAWSEILAHWSAGPRFTLNLTLFQRPDMHAELASLVGDFTSLVLLVVEGAGTLSFSERARMVQQQLWTDLSHAQVSAVRVLREAARRKGHLSALSVPVVFTSALGVDDNSDTERTTHNTLGEITWAVSQTPQVWIDHQVVARNGELIFSWDCVDALFPSGLLDVMFDAYCTLLAVLTTEDSAWGCCVAESLPDRAEQHKNPVPRKSPALSAADSSGDNSVNSAMIAVIRASLRDIAAIDNPRDEVNFFELGLTSLHLIRLRLSLQQVLSMAFPLEVMFSHSSISRLAGWLGRLSHQQAESVAQVAQGRHPARRENARRRQRLQQLAVTSAHDSQEEKNTQKPGIRQHCSTFTRRPLS